MIPRVLADFVGQQIEDGPRTPLGPYRLNARDMEFLVNDAQGCLSGIAATNGNSRIILTLLRAPDSMPHGIGLVTQFSPDAARHMAHSLIKLADRIEAEAAAQATAALDRAAGKGAA